MIYTITPNPALDLGGTIDHLVPNEKAYVYDETRFPGGNAINAARIIKKLHQSVIAGGFLGGGIGQELESLLKQEKVPCHFIRIQGNTRVSVTVSDAKSHLQTRLSFSGPTIRRKEIEKLFCWIKSMTAPSLVLIGGSLPPGVSASHIKRIIETARRRDIPCVVDIPGKLLKEVVGANPLFIKPNLTEFQQFTGSKATTKREVFQVARRWSAKIPLICVSSVENGALLITRDKVWFGTIPRVSIKTTVGAGDSMVGAMSAWLWKNRIRLGQNFSENGEDLLRWGLAAATATLTTPGTMLGEYKQIVQYYPKVKVREEKF